MVGKRIQFDDETWQAIEAVADDTGKAFQELADEAFADLLKKHKQRHRSGFGSPMLSLRAAFNQCALQSHEQACLSHW